MTFLHPWINSGRNFPASKHNNFLQCLQNSRALIGSLGFNLLKLNASYAKMGLAIGLRLSLQWGEGEGGGKKKKCIDSKLTSQQIYFFQERSRFRTICQLNNNLFPSNFPTLVLPDGRYTACGTPPLGAPEG